MYTSLGLNQFRDRLYNELGKGKREALAKLAIEKLEQAGRPFRLAVDISIWQFQILSGKGGKNPALRTLYFRLLRFLALSIQPLFVFDGPHKPPTKRNVKTANQGPSLPNMLAKELLKLFGFPYLTAPGEAEAECALLQREGIVDAVMSEDVDTLMFGCRMSIRDWSGEGKSKSPTHVSIYSSESIWQNHGLDREGMVLVALMSGGDYDTIGIPGCGPKVACQAAKAGFGKELCKLTKDDSIGFKQWRERLNYELRTNESGYFQRKSNTVRLSDEFPNQKVLSYYARPVVSSAEKIADLRNRIQWDSPLDVLSLRLFVADAFEWQYLEGACKFLRGLAPALLVHQLSRRAVITNKEDNIELQAAEETKYVKGICDKPRTHFDTGRIKELRVIYMPSEMTGLDLENEETGEYAGIVDSETEAEAVRTDAEERSQCISPAKSRRPSRFDPKIAHKMWIPESLAKLGVPLMVENWEADMRNPKKFAIRKVRERAAMAPGGMKKGAMDAFFKVKKHDVERNQCERQQTRKAREGKNAIQTEDIELPAGAKTSNSLKLSVGADGDSKNIQTNFPSTPSKIVNRTPKKQRAASMSASSPRDINSNPWTLSRRPSDTLDIDLDRTKRYSALGINCSPRTPERNRNRLDFVSKAGDAFEQPIMIESPLNNASASSKPASPLKATMTAKKYHLTKSPHKSGLLGAPVSSQAAIGPRIHRRQDFGTPLMPTMVARESSSPSLPSPSILLHTPRPNVHAILSKQTASSNRSRIPSLSMSHRKYIVIRNSLNGAWRETDDWEIGSLIPNQILAGVERVDLTGV